MDFVSLVKQGGFLWKAWVACHYERRLKRHDYLNANVKGTCDFLLENLSEIPLRCLGHLLLGVLRLLLRQATDLETKADEVRTALQTSLSSGPLPTVPTVAASAVTLRPLAEQGALVSHLPDLSGADGLDVPMEECPELEVEASLEEGRRHVAPLALITLSPDTPQRTPERSLDLGDDFEAPSAEDLASLAAVGQAALDQMRQAEAPSPAIPEQSPVQAAQPKQALDHLEKSAGRESLPPIDFLLGAASSPSTSPAGDILMRDCDDDIAAAAEAAALEAEAFAAEAAEAADEAEATVRCLQEELGELPIEFLLKGAGSEAENEDTVPVQPLVQSPEEQEEADEACLDLMPRAIDEALQEVVQEPKQKRRRRRIWLDEKATQIPVKKYEDTSKITRANPLEYGLFLPHRSSNVGLTTMFGDLCPLLCIPLQRAAEIGARRRRLRAEESAIPSPPRGALGQLAEESDPSRVVAESVVPALQPVQADEARSPVSSGPELAEVASPPDAFVAELASSPAHGQSSEAQAAVAQLGAEAVVEGDASLRPVEDMAQSAEEAQPPSPVDAGMAPEASQQEAAEETAEEAAMETADEAPEEAKGQVAEEDLGPATAPHAEADSDMLVPVPEPEATPASPAAPAPRSPEVPAESPAAASLPPAKRQAQQSPGGQLVPVKVAPKVKVPLLEAKQEEDLEVDLDKVSAKQGKELRESLQEDASVSFLDLCSSDQSGAEAAACRFVDLLSLHMSGAISLRQDEPYADIAVVRGCEWEAWCDESKRGTKREARVAEAGA